MGQKSKFQQQKRKLKFDFKKPTIIMLTFIVKGRQYDIAKSVLKQEMKTAENNQLDKKNTIQLPSWVENQQFQAVHQYLVLVDSIKDIETQRRQQRINQFLVKSISVNKKLNSTKKLINIMRVSDYLTLQKFQQYYIQKCVIETLNNENCTIYLEETHKKLKNTSSGTAQAWYNLLNSCIDYISYNLPEVYLNQPERIQKLHEKILGQILDRTIKYQTILSGKSKNKAGHDSRQKQIIFNLLMKSKKVNSVDALCNSLKSSLSHKKINKKMHAKLSWKLHDLNQITQTKVKNFKFLDLNWILQAKRQPDQTLKIKLTLLPIEQENTNYSSNYSIGVFYSKLYWTVDKYLGASQLTTTQTTNEQRSQIQKNQGQKSLQIHYICLKNPAPIDIFDIDHEFQKTLFNKKLELSIYCSIDQCYSFVVNYIINDYSKLRLDQKKISKEQIYALIDGSKAAGKHSQAVWLIKYLTKNQIQIPVRLLENLPYDKLPTYETQFLKKLVRNDNPILDQVFVKKEVNSRVVQIESEINSLSSSKVSENQETKSTHSRAPSRGRHRKIFGESPQKQVQSIGQLPNGTSNLSYNKPSVSISNSMNTNLQFQRLKQQELQQILQITNMKNYLLDRGSNLYDML